MTALAETREMWRPGLGQRAQIAWRLALRELRGGLRGFGIFIACIALGVMVAFVALLELWLVNFEPGYGSERPEAQ